MKFSQQFSMVFVMAMLSTFDVSSDHAAGGEIQFVEDYVLAQDRERVIQQLIPGTDDYYFYRCLSLQNEQSFGEVDKLLIQWQQRHGETSRLQEIRNRQMLLTYAQSPEKTLEYLIRRLRPNLRHQRDRLEGTPKLPTKVDPALIEFGKLKRDALQRHKGLQGIDDQGLLQLRATDLNPLQRRELLSRLTRPDHPELVDLVMADLDYEGSRGFGSLGIHAQLTLAQLDDCAARQSKLENETNFVNAYLRKLRPNPDVDWRNDPSAQAAYLASIWKYVQGLHPSHNSLKANVLYHRLMLDESQGTYDKERFLQYLALPRPVFYVSPRLNEGAEARRYPVDLAVDHSNVTELAAIGTDEPLVRRYLLHLLEDETTYSAYEPFIRDDYLRQVFAEAKIVAGLGDSERWHAMLAPEQYQALKDRVDLDFAPTNARRFASDDALSVDLFVKNVQKLIVKVYEVNTRNFYRQFRREVNTDIALDGLIPNHEVTHTYDDSPFRRKLRHFEFPEMREAGVYVIDFIGNGKSSRVVVRKGMLHHVVKTTASGQRFAVFDDKLRPVTNATLWMDGQQFEAAEDGTIQVPFSTKPGRQAIILSSDGFSSLAFFEHMAEEYQLTTAAYIERGSLLPRQDAAVLLRPELRLAGVPVSLGVLEDVEVRFRSTDLGGISSEHVVKDVKLLENLDTPVPFKVPSRLASLEVIVTAQVKNVSKNNTQSLQSSYDVAINQIDATEKIEDLHLSRVGDAFVLELFGKTGEAKPHRPVRVDLTHAGFTDPIRLELATDSEGSVQLGQLAGISRLSARGPNSEEKDWQLLGDRRSLSGAVHIRAGEVARIPHMRSKQELSSTDISLLELRGGSFAYDRTASAKVDEHFIELHNLSAGDYSLRLKSDFTVLIRVTQGDVESGFTLGEVRGLEMRPLAPLQLTEVKTDDQELRVSLENASQFTRVHVFATRFYPAFDPFDAFHQIREPALQQTPIPWPASYYMAGRDLGDELRYVLDRAYAKKYPGNMLERPTLLLNAWPTRSTETASQRVAQGEDFEAAPEAAAAMTSEARRRLARGLVERGRSDFASLDFLSEPTAVVINARPDENGDVVISLEELGPHQHLHVVAVDPFTTVYRSIALTKVTMPFRDLRLATGLDTEKHYTQQKQITLLSGGETFELADITTGRFEVYDSLNRVYALLSTLSGNEVLRQFQFIMDWPTLTTEEKADKYSEFACHELNFFLYKKDPRFFADVVRPYLENKQHKTFLDLWLLEADLTDFLRPWEYGQLNVAERLLLAERIDGEQQRARRWVEDTFSLIPRDVTRQNQWFESAIKGGQLDFDDSLQDLLEEEKEVLGRKRGRAGRMGGMGGGGFAAPSARTPAFDDDASPEALAENSSADLSKRRAQRSKSQLRFDKQAADAGAAFFTLEGRRAMRQLYTQLEKTQEWAENNYYRLPIHDQNQDLLQVNAFWIDYARRPTDSPFFSIHWPDANRNFTEMMFVISLLDLPFEAGQHQSVFADQRMTLTVASPLVVFQEQIREASLRDQQSPVLISQNYFRDGERHQVVQGETRDKFITDEFLTQSVYGCQVVVTNPSSTPRRIQLLLQIPHQSLPARGGKATQTVDLELPAYHTDSQDYFFYFPVAGQYDHFPVHVAQQKELLGFARATKLNVVNQLSNVDKQSWDYVSQFAADNEVLQFLRDHNVLELNLERMAFRMANESFFHQVIELLTDRHVFDPAIWAYSLKHNQPQAIATYLEHNDAFLRQCGSSLDCELLTINPVVRKRYQQLDYKPLVNARAHQLGQRRQILNDRLFSQYHSLLSVLSYQRDMSDEQKLAVTYYLLLQDRIGEASALFASIQPGNVPTRMQYDYFAAYLDCFREEPTRARAIIARYVNYPVEKWQQAFVAVGAMLDEVAGRDVAVVDAEDRTQAQTAAAGRQANFDFVVEDKEVRVDYQQLDELQVNYYLIDLELLFSSNPFVQKFNDQFSHIKPNQTQRIALNSDQTRQAFTLPSDLHNRNVLVEIVADGISRSHAYYSNSLNVQLSENYGQLQVSDANTGRWLPKTYVKVYAELQDGSTKFYKDGYTDLRGRFDYSSLSTNDLDFVKRFSLLVLDDSRGGLVREAQVPKR